MQSMTPQEASVNIWDFNYPCYVSPIPKGDKFTHVPGLFEFKHLDGIHSFVIEGYKTPDKLWICDVIPFYLWKKNVCNITFEKRLKIVRAIVFESVAKPEHVMDLDAVLIDNPAELTDYCDNLLTQGYERVRIMDVNGNYVFGQSNNGEYLELAL